MAIRFGFYRSPGATRRSLRFERRRAQALQTATPLAIQAALARFREIDRDLEPPTGPSGRTTFPPSPSPSGRFVDRLQAGRAVPNLVPSPTRTIRPSRPPIPGEELVGTPQGPEFPVDAIGLTGRLERQIFGPSAAAGLQIAESPAGTGIPAVGAAKVAQTALERAGVPKRLSPFPRTRTFGEAFEGGLVNPFKAIVNKEEQEKAQAVLEEAGLPRALAARVVFDPLHVIPLVGFTKVDDFVRLARLASQAKGAAKARILANPSFQRTIKALQSKAGGGRPLGGAIQEGFVPGGVPSAQQGPAAKLTELIQSAKKPRAATELLKHEELQTRIGRAGRVIESGKGTPEQRLARAKGQLKGELPSAKFEPPRPQLSEPEVQSLIDDALTFNFGPGQRFKNINAADTLVATLEGRLPTVGELALLERVFGPELVKAIQAKRALGTKAWRIFVEGINVPRRLLTFLDHSFPGRQGIRLAPRYPKEWGRSFLAGAKSLFSEETALAVDRHLLTDGTPILVREGETVRSVPYGRLKEITGLYHAPLGEAAKISAREEEMVARWMNSIPGLGRAFRASERGFVTSGNLIRSDTFKKVLLAATEGGEAIDLETARGLANLFTRATGRGTLGPAEEFAPLLSGLQFAPRFRLSGPQWAANLLNRNPAVRTEAAKQIVSFVGAGSTILAMVKLSGLGDVEIDPRSSDFGKIRLGKQRIDFWGGLQPVVRSIAQLLTDRRITSTGDNIPADRKEVAWRYFRSGMSPAASGVTDVLTGETIIGEEIEPTVGSARQQAFNRLVPIAWQDIVDAVREEGLRGGFVGATALIGIGVQSYETFAQERAKAFRQETGLEFDYNNSGHWAILRTNPNLVEKFGQLGEQAQETQGFLSREMTKLQLPQMAQALSSDDMQAAVKFREAWEDFEGLRADAAARLAFGRDRDPADDTNYRRWREIDRNDYRDPVTFEIDYGAYRKDKDAAFAQVDPAIRQAIKTVGAPDPEVARWATELVKARELRRELFEIPKYLDPGKSVAEMLEYEDRLKDFMNHVREELDRAKRKFAPDFSLTLPEAAIILGKRDFKDQQLGEDAALIFRNKVKRNPERETFLLEHQEELVPFFPELYRRTGLREQLSDELFETAISR